MLAGLAWLGGLISMISESLGTLLTTMRVGPIAIGPPDGEDKLLQDIPEGTFCLLKFKKFRKMPEINKKKQWILDIETLNSEYDDTPPPDRKKLQYKNSVYNTKTEWKPSKLTDL